MRLRASQYPLQKPIADRGEGLDSGLELEVLTLCSTDVSTASYSYLALLVSHPLRTMHMLKMEPVNHICLTHQLLVPRTQCTATTRKFKVIACQQNRCFKRGWIAHGSRAVRWCKNLDKRKQNVGAMMARSGYD